LNDWNDEQLHDLAGAYVLDALEPGEQRVYEAHLRTCEACKREVAELAQVVGVLPLAVELVEPPASLRDRIIAAVQDEGDARPVLTAIPGGVSVRRERRRVAPWEVIVGLAAALVLAAVGLWNVQLQHKIDQQRADITYQQAVSNALAGGASVSQLPGTAAAPGARAAMVQPKNGREAYLIVKNLPATPSHKVYQLWFVRGTPKSAITFQYGGGGAQIYHLPMTSKGYPIAAVTVEPGPNGSPAPTGPKVIVGKLSA
jgi:anti-sigma-K factor RskA